MSVTAKCVVNAQYASNTDTTLYTVAGTSRFIVDKCTVQNSDASSQTITINIVPSGGTVGASNVVVNAKSIATTVTYDATEMQNQVLNGGDQISFKASVASKLVVRVSGREVT